MSRLAECSCGQPEADPADGHHTGPIIHFQRVLGSLQWLLADCLTDAVVADLWAFDRGDASPQSEYLAHGGPVDADLVNEVWERAREAQEAADASASSNAESEVWLAAKAPGRKALAVSTTESEMAEDAAQLEAFGYTVERRKSAPAGMRRGY